MPLEQLPIFSTVRASTIEARRSQSGEIETSSGNGNPFSPSLAVRAKQAYHYEERAAVSAPLMVNQSYNVSKFRCATKSPVARDSKTRVESNPSYGTRGMLAVCTVEIRLPAARGDTRMSEKTKKEPETRRVYAVRSGGEDHR